MMAQMIFAKKDAENGMGKGVCHIDLYFLYS